MDGSTLSEAILPRVAPMLLPGDQVLILRVVHLPLQDIHVSLPVGELVGEAETYARGMAAKLRGEGIDASGFAEFGAPADAILGLAEREQATMIAMCTHGRSGLARVALGSVAEEVLRRAEVPVWFSKPSQEAAGAIRTILLPLDGSSLSEEVLPQAAALARRFGARIVLFHVFPKRKAPAELAPPKMPLRESEKRLRAEGVTAHTDFGQGDPAECILTAATEADLVLMTSHGRSGLSRLVLGSVAENVVRRSPVPVIVQRASVRAAKGAVYA
jgi:nucleotide-binding universal stress UspA family protein